MLDFELATIQLIKSFEKTFNIKLENTTLTIEEKKELEILLKDKYNYAK